MATWTIASSFEISVGTVTAATIVVGSLAGKDGVDGADGADGADGSNGTNGQGVPTGGTANQILEKIDGTDYNTQWVTNAGEANPDLVSQAEAEAGVATTERIWSAQRVSQAIAALGGGGGGATTVYKTADETRTSTTTATIDDDMQLSLDASSIYQFTVNGYYNAYTTPDLKGGFSYPSGATIVFTRDNDGLAGLSPVSETWEQTFAGADLTNKSWMWNGIIETTNAGTFGFKWSQNTSSGLPTTLHKGSNIIIRKLN